MRWVTKLLSDKKPFSNLRNYESVIALSRRNIRLFSYHVDRIRTSEDKWWSKTFLLVVVINFTCFSIILKLNFRDGLFGKIEYHFPNVKQVSPIESS